MGRRRRRLGLLVTMNPKKPAKEFKEQIELMKWVGLHLRQYPELDLLFHIPNGELRDPATAAKLQAMGVKPGVCDLFLPIARGGWHGCFIEMKRRGETPTPVQVAFMQAVERQGYFVQPCYDWIQASETLVE